MSMQESYMLNKDQVKSIIKTRSRILLTIMRKLGLDEDQNGYTQEDITYTDLVTFRQQAMIIAKSLTQQCEYCVITGSCYADAVRTFKILKHLDNIEFMVKEKEKENAVHPEYAKVTDAEEKSMEEGLETHTSVIEDIRVTVVIPVEIGSLVATDTATVKEAQPLPRDEDTETEEKQEETVPHARVKEVAIIDESEEDSSLEKIEVSFIETEVKPIETFIAEDEEIIDKKEEMSSVEITEVADTVRKVKYIQVVSRVLEEKVTIINESKEIADTITEEYHTETVPYSTSKKLEEVSEPIVEILEDVVMSIKVRPVLAAPRPFAEKAEDFPSESETTLHDTQLMDDLPQDSEAVREITKVADTVKKVKSIQVVPRVLEEKVIIINESKEIADTITEEYHTETVPYSTSKKLEEVSEPIVEILEDAVMSIKVRPVLAAPRPFAEKAEDFPSESETTLHDTQLMDDLPQDSEAVREIIDTEITADTLNKEHAFLLNEVIRLRDVLQNAIYRLTKGTEDVVAPTAGETAASKELPPPVERGVMPCGHREHEWAPPTCASDELAVAATAAPRQQLNECIAKLVSVRRFLDECSSSDGFEKLRILVDRPARCCDQDDNMLHIHGFLNDIPVVVNLDPEGKTLPKYKLPKEIEEMPAVPVEEEMLVRVVKAVEATPVEATPVEATPVKGYDQRKEPEEQLVSPLAPDEPFQAEHELTQPIKTPPQDEEVLLTGSPSIGIPYYPTVISLPYANQELWDFKGELMKLDSSKLALAAIPPFCCRKSTINEASDDELPYSVSLKSLPIDRNDYDAIKKRIEQNTIADKDLYHIYPPSASTNLQEENDDSILEKRNAHNNSSKTHSPLPISDENVLNDKPSEHQANLEYQVERLEIGYQIIPVE